MIKMFFDKHLKKNGETPAPSRRPDLLHGWRAR
jgi:hypothetical protein